MTSDSEEEDLNLDDVDSEDLSDDENDFKVPEESKISKTLSAKTTRTVVILVLILLFLLELCSIDTWVETDIVHQAAIGNMAFLYGLKKPFYSDYLKSIDHFIKLTHDKKAIDYPLVYLKCVQSAEYSTKVSVREWEPKLSTLRKSEFTAVTSKTVDGLEFTAAYSQKTYAQTEAFINICKTLFIVMVLGVASIQFTKDATELVLDPLERMIEKVKLIAKNPLAAATDEIDQAGVMSFMNKEEKVLDSKE